MVRLPAIGSATSGGGTGEHVAGQVHGFCDAPAASAVRDQDSRRQSLLIQHARTTARIARAIAARDADRAAKEMAVHLDHIEETTRRAMKAEMTALARLTRP